jgi:4-hydroxymandelate oxidase
VVDAAALEEQAAEVLDRVAYDYFRGGADEESTVRDNVAAWGRLRIRPHVLRDVTSVGTGTTVLGTPVAAPVLVAPTAYHELAGPEGESGTARGAAAAGTVMVVSTFATQPLETVAGAAPDAVRWFQLYVYRDPGWTRELVARAVDAGYRALVLTVDVPVLGNRRRDERNAFALPPPLTLAHAPADTPRHDDGGGGTEDGSALAAHVRQQVSTALTFDDIAALGAMSGLPVVVKGVLRGDDAAGCVDAGAAAVCVSNHGGRQLDGAVATADALPDVVEAVAGAAEVYVDGGVRHGVDVLRALALGARAVLVGRPVVYGLAVGGADGVRAVLDELRDELARAMALCGVTSVADIGRDLVVTAG